MEIMNKNNSEEAMMLLAEELIDDLLSASDEEVIAEIEGGSRGVDTQVSAIRSEIKMAIDSFRKDRLANARAAVARHKEDKPENRTQSIDVQRQIAELLSSGKMRSKMTLAARNDRGSSESDILSAFADLCELEGVERPIRRLEFGSAPKAEYILRDLGVTAPQEIDVEAIAWHLGAKVKFDNLDRCEARIIGSDDAAVITVNKRASPERQRFSICHELGHWIYHRKRMLLCPAEEIERPSADSISLERVADRFASELLMPSYLFVPISQSLGRPSMHVVRKLSEIFNTSQTATAIRLVELSQLPLLLVDHGKNGRRWYARSPTVSKDWIPNGDLSPESSAFTMIFGRAPNSMPPRTVSALNWFVRHDASRFEIIEESVRIAVSEVLTLLAFKNAHEFSRYSQNR
jgi:hypothetical protein